MRVMLAGPIKAWWDEWDSDRHKVYLEWRELLSTSLVEAGHLVYRPWEAWKGQWDDNDGDRVAQAVNDVAVRTAEVVLNLTPPGVPSHGTDVEVILCESIGKTIIDCPPPGEGELKMLAHILLTLRTLEPYIKSLPV